ncbi:MAG: glycine dehydrogenase, partial [Bdellovibrionales bacterium]|nr:glycine dehydrogenase [Bdellovibrionales bacterium]
MNNNGIDYDPTTLKRELNNFYIAITKEEEQEMLNDLKLSSMDDLYSHIPSSLLFKKAPTITESLSYNKLINHLSEISNKNNILTSFIGHGLKDYETHEIVPFVSNIRGLTTAYTPYQPEVGQGTLNSLWIYSCLLSKLTGFEAINASLYDRSTCLFEALKTSLRLRPSRKKVLVCETIYSSDIKVIKTLSKHTELEIVIVPQSVTTGKTNHADLREILEQNSDEFAAIAFPQVNAYGNLED